MNCNLMIAAAWSRESIVLAMVVAVPPNMVGWRLRWRCYVETSTNPTEIDVTTSDFVIACDRYSRIIWLCLHERDSNRNKVLQLIDDSIRWEDRFAVDCSESVSTCVTTSWLANHHLSRVSVVLYKARRACLDTVYFYAIMPGRRCNFPPFPFWIHTSHHYY